MNTQYKESLDFLFSQLPMFSRVGAAAYKPGLERSEALDNHFGNPHRRFRAIHIAGTNGKGSTSHLTAAVLQAAGYKVGLYTSPHLVDFRERMRVNGEMIPQEAVVDFVRRWREGNYEGDRPSFFELTMMMAFEWFAKQEVDYAVIEVGMGGRLDSTNIISPILTAITNISFDHTQFLGSTLPQIAAEKAGIIKEGIPVVIGEAEPEVEAVFRARAAEVGAPIIEAYRHPLLESCQPAPEWGMECKSATLGTFYCALGGEYQRKNINTALHIIAQLRAMGIEISPEAERQGFAEVEQLTGLRGRWMRVNREPLAIADTGHNEAGLRYNLPRLAAIRAARRGALRIVMGFVADKDVEHILDMFPADAEYYLTQAAIPRAMKVADLAALCERKGLRGRSYPTVAEAYAAALADAAPTDLLYVGGSTFIVADLLTPAP